MEKFQTYFGLHLAVLVFSAAEQLSTTLQGKQISAEDASQAAAAYVRHLARTRTEETFNEFYAKVVESSTDLTDPPVLPRRKKIPARFNDGADNHVYTELSSFYRHQFFEVL